MGEIRKRGSGFLWEYRKRSSIYIIYYFGNDIICPKNGHTTPFDDENYIKAVISGLITNSLVRNMNSGSICYHSKPINSSEGSINQY